MRPAIVSAAATVSPGGKQAGPSGSGEALEQRGGCRASDQIGSNEEGGDEPGGDEALTLAVIARDYIWLYDFRHGLGHRKIAARDGVSVRHVRDGIERARALDARVSKDDPIEHLKPGRQADLGFRLIPLFPIGAFTPASVCPHHDPIGRGSTLCCMVCHTSGMDDHPGLRRDPETDPSPEPSPRPEPAAADSEECDSRRETRKERRRRRFAEAMAVA